LASTFILYRILGNDLPPRHGERQTLENLRFILAHEPQFPDCEKRWVVNRIADAAREAELLRVIADAGQKAVHIPFDLAEYGRRHFDADGLPGEFNPLEILAGKSPPHGGGHVLEWLYRQKNLYAVNVNGARNAALDDGRAAGARWIMPWDGGCFLTMAGFTGIREAIAQNLEARYIVVPMTRSGNSREYLRADFKPDAIHEPQLVFRGDALERFDERLRYGHRPKADLLVRLGVPGRWHTWKPTSWEPRNPPATADYGKIATGGWVGRLDAQSSDAKVIETDDSTRWLARFRGLAAHCAELDRRLVQGASGRLNCYGHLLPREAAPPAALLAAADGLLGANPVSVTDKPQQFAGIARNDYVSIARYAYRGPDGRYVSRDGQHNPGALRGRPEADAYDRFRLQTMIEATTTLALAQHFTADRRYGDHAARFVRTWFIDPDTRMTPHNRFAQIKPDRPTEVANFGLIDFRDLWALSDALRLLRQAGSLSEADETALVKWFRAFGDQLVKRTGGGAAMNNNIGVYHNLLVASLAAYTGDDGVLVTTLSRACLRVAAQVRPWGWQETETRRAAPLHYSLFALQGLIGLAWIGRHCGMDVWSYGNTSRQTIPMATRFVATNRRLFSDYAAAAAHFDDRIEAALRAIPADAADRDAIADLPRQPLAHPETLGMDDGFMPWQALLLSGQG
jgi:hypothetical protein